MRSQQQKSPRGSVEGPEAARPRLSAEAETTTTVTRSSSNASSRGKKRKSLLSLLRRIFRPRHRRRQTAHSQPLHAFK